jgi:SAM-dependent methyltransferase
MTAKRYDKHYFDRWYRGSTRVHSEAEVRRKVTMAVGVSEYFLRRTLRSVLDVGCGEGAWFTHLAVLRPKITYLGLDPSDYAVQRFGRERNIRKAAFGDLGSVRLPRTFDLVVCSDAMHYMNDDEIERGLPHLVAASNGLLFIEVLTKEDDVVGDLQGMIQRPAAWYRKRLDALGALQAGPYTWLAPSLRDSAAALESV